MNPNSLKIPPLIVKLKLTPKQHELARNYQKSYEKIFNKQVSLEELFKISVFFSLNINTNKIAILDSYDTNNVQLSQKRESSNKKRLAKTTTKQVSKNKLKKYSTPKNSDLELSKKDKQTALGGF